VNQEGKALSVISTVALVAGVVAAIVATHLVLASGSVRTPRSCL
jgi:hypothetical protein